MVGVVNSTGYGPINPSVKTCVFSWTPPVVPRDRYGYHIPEHMQHNDGGSESEPKTTTLNDCGSCAPLDIDPHRVIPDGIDDAISKWQGVNWEIDANSGKIPKQPANPSQNAKSNDASTWGSFNAALSNATEYDHFGVGFPCAQPGHPFVFIDVDIPNDSEWVPNCEMLGGCVVERSPTGNLRIILRECERPDWWIDQSDPGKDAREVKLFDESGYVTLTGDTLDGFGTPLEPTHSQALERWLKEAWYAFNTDVKEGEEPWANDSRETNLEKGLSGLKNRGSVRTTGSHNGTTIDLDVYDVLPRIRFPEEERRSHPYHGSSTGTNFRVDEGSETWRCERHAATGNALHLLGMEAGIIDCGEWTDRDIDTTTWRKLFNYARKQGYDIPDPKLRQLSPQPDGKTANGVSWEYVREQYAEKGQKRGRYCAAKVLEDRTAWMHVLEEDRLWIYDDDTGTYNSWGEQQAACRLEQGLGEFYSTSEKNEVIARLEARNQVHRRELNGGEHPEPLLCVGNGVINLETGDLHSHSPEYLFIRGVRWDYEPENADPTPIIEFLDDVTRRPEDRDTILDHLAHGLIPGHPYRAFVMMYGPGSNGKTQLQDVIEGFVGSENAAGVKLSALTGDDSFATGALPGKFVNIGDDESVGEIRDTSMLKSLTGGGTLRANKKHEKQFEFKNEAAMFFSANEPPRITEEKDAINDRLYPIEMPYQFKGENEYDPENRYHKRKVSNIAADLIENEAAMRGLLALCVEHAQRLIDTDGQYSMPEGPAERRLRYEAASDPIARFVVHCFEPGNESDAVLKDDAYTVYTALCEADNERLADAITFKKNVTQQTGIDVVPARVRTLTPGDGRDQAWRYVRFSETAVSYMPDRLQERYFPEGKWTSDDRESSVGTGDEQDVTSSAFGAIPLMDAAEKLTGYVTVTVQIAITDRLGEEETGVRATVADTSGIMDIVAWDEPFTTQLVAAEGKYIVLKNAKVTEYEGSHQLVAVDEVTSIERIQAGVGHTEEAVCDDAQAGAGTARAQADGGQLGGAIDGLQARTLEYLRGSDAPTDIVSVDEIAEEVNEPPEAVESSLDALAEKGRVIRHHDGVSLG